MKLLPWRSPPAACTLALAQPAATDVGIASNDAVAGC
jgi:hypothetical protein